LVGEQFFKFSADGVGVKVSVQGSSPDADLLNWK
jgi:hypothetical protein